MKIFYLKLCFMFLSLMANSQKTVVYVNLVSHNEDSYQHYLNIPSAYYEARVRMVQMAEMCYNKGAVWHLGSDWCLPLAVLKYDTGVVTIPTNLNNVLVHISEQYNVSIDPHSHESSYNYSDVAYLLDSTGVNVSKIMSGFLWNTDQNGHYWFDYQLPVQGDTFTHFLWQPDILWGAGTPGHTNDPLYTGVWRPADSSQVGFITHAPANHLIYYAQGCHMRLFNNSNVNEVLQPLRDLVYAIENNLIDTNKIFCTSIFFNESQLVNNFFIQKAGELIDSVNLYVAAGRVQWMKIDSVVTYWNNTFGNVQSIEHCDSWTSINIEEINVPDSSPFVVAPNPASESIQIITKEPNFEVKIVNLAGQLIFEGINTTIIDISMLSPGTYIVWLSTHKCSDRKKFILN